MNLLYIDRPLVINPALAEKIGLNEAIILQQLNYWLTRTDSGISYDGVQWVYNTYSEWREQAPFFSERTIQRVILKLEEVGIIRSEMLRKSKGDRTKFYTINQSHELLAPPSRQDGITVTSGCLDHSAKMAPSSRQDGTLSTETTTETTTDIIHSDHESLNTHAVEQVSLTGKSVATTNSKKQKSKITARELVIEFGVSEQIANEYLVVRGRAPLTPTALKLILNEADKIGWSLQQALTACCENSWRGFRADWIKNQQLRLGSQNNEGFKTAQASIDRLNDTSWAK